MHFVKMKMNELFSPAGLAHKSFVISSSEFVIAFVKAGVTTVGSPFKWICTQIYKIYSDLLIIRLLCIRKK